MADTLCERGGDVRLAGIALISYFGNGENRER